jgi:predicted transcriptional regulator
MEREPRVRSFLTTDFETIGVDGTIHDAVDKLAVLDRKCLDQGTVGTKTLVVTDEDGYFKGLLTMLDILQAIEPPFLREADHLVGVGWDGLFEEIVHQAENKMVKESMTDAEDIIGIGPDDRLIKVVELMVKHRLRRLPVLEDEKVIGVVRLYDIFHEVAREMSKQGGE